MTLLAALYTDEDMSALVAILLRSRGLDVTTVPEQAAIGKTDGEQLEFASALSRCLLIHNRVDFERLHLQYVEAESSTLALLLCRREVRMKSRGGLAFWCVR